MARKVKYTTHEGTVGDICLGEIEDLAGEMREWFDNMPEQLQGGNKGEQVSEAADTLEGLELSDVPEFLTDLKIVWSEGHKGGRHGDPRWLRRDNATAPWEGAKAAVEEWLEENEPIDIADDADPVTQEMLDEQNTRQEQIDEAETFRDELDQKIEEANNLEFPSMFG